MGRVLAIALLWLGAGPAALADDDHFERLVDWLGGRWDNRAQAQEDAAGAALPIDRHGRRALDFVPIAAPAIDGQLFALRVHDERGLDGPPTRVELRRLVPSRVSTEILHEFLVLERPAAWGDLGRSLASLQGLREADVRSERGCRIYWRWLSDHFEGRTRRGRCVVSDATEETRVERFVSLYEDRLVRHDVYYGSDGERRARQGGRTPEVFDRQ